MISLGFIPVLEMRGEKGRRGERKGKQEDEDESQAHEGLARGKPRDF